MEIYDAFFQRQVKAMFAGIEMSMENKLFYLCALALSTYTEIMGGFVTGKLKEERYSRENYEAFLPYLGKSYVDLNIDLLKHKTNLHKLVRSKLVHEFSLRGNHGIMISESAQEKIGVEIIFNQDQIVSTIINVREYYRDFKKGVEKYYHDLEISARHPVFSQDHILFDNFMTAFIDRSAVEEAMRKSQ